MDNEDHKTCGTTLLSLCMWGTMSLVIVSLDSNGRIFLAIGFLYETVRL